MVGSSAALTVQLIEFNEDPPLQNTLLPSGDIPCFLHTSNPFDSSSPSLFCLPFLQKAQVPYCFSICPSPASNQSRAPLSLGQLLLLLFPHENPCSIAAAAAMSAAAAAAPVGAPSTWHRYCFPPALSVYFAHKNLPCNLLTFSCNKPMVIFY